MGGDGGYNSYLQTEHWNTLNYNQSKMSTTLQQKALNLQKESTDIAKEGLELQKESQELTKEANAMQRESLDLSKTQTQTAKESLAVAKSQAETAKQSQKLQKAQILEPEKKIDLAKTASDAAARAQALRNGLGSTFSRSGFGLGSTSLTSATSGKVTKLGG